MQATRDRLLRDLRDGAFREGRLPPEAELARALGVSRATVRAALLTLAEDGVVTRRRRHGTVLNPQALRGGMPLNRLVSFRELIEQSGREPSVDPLVRREATPSPEAVAALRIAADAPCLVVERLLRSDGRPVITVTDVLPRELLRVAPDEIVDADSTFAFIAENTAASVDHSLVELVPCVATEDAPVHLELDPGAPYLVLAEVLFSPDGTPVAFSRIAVDPRRIRLTLARRQS